MAKVSKILLLAEQGSVANFENLSLDEINVDMDVAVEDNGTDDEEEAGTYYYSI
jgi:hypothetical protein